MVAVNGAEDELTVLGDRRAERGDILPGVGEDLFDRPRTIRIVRPDPERRRRGKRARVFRGFLKLQKFRMRADPERASFRLVKEIVGSGFEMRFAF